MQSEVCTLFGLLCPAVIVCSHVTRTFLHQLFPNLCLDRYFPPQSTHICTNIALTGHIYTHRLTVALTHSFTDIKQSYDDYLYHVIIWSNVIV